MKNRVISLFVCGVFALSAFAFAIPFANAAGNYSDTIYRFDFSSARRSSFTEVRAKKDSTSSYMYCKAGGGTYQARVYAQSAAGSSAASGPVYTFSKGMAKKMTNYVHESGFPYARIKGTPNVSGDSHYTGVWSPDSI